MRVNYLFIGSVIIMSIGILGIVSSLNEKKDFFEGKIVNMRVIEKPLDCHSINTRNSFIKLEYDGKLYNKKIGKKYCKYLERDSIEVILSPDKQTVFFESEHNVFIRNAISGMLLLVIGIIIFLKSRK